MSNSCNLVWSASGIRRVIPASLGRRGPRFSLADSCLGNLFSLSKTSHLDAAVVRPNCRGKREFTTRVSFRNRRLSSTASTLTISAAQTTKKVTAKRASARPHADLATSKKASCDDAGNCSARKTNLAASQGPTKKLAAIRHVAPWSPDQHPGMNRPTLTNPPAAAIAVAMTAGGMFHLQTTSCAKATTPVIDGL